jgi:hypothetical protein
VPLEQVLAGVVPLSIAAFCYPVGNQLLNRLRHNTTPLYRPLQDPLAAVLLMTLGALPFLIGLVVVIRPPAPDVQQIASTGIIALVAGCLATPLFIHARNTSSNPYLIAAVDATQAGEVAFTLLGETLLTGHLALGLADYAGLAAVMGGLTRLRSERGKCRAEPRTGAIRRARNSLVPVLMAEARLSKEH